MYMNSKENAKAVVEGGDVISRPSEFPSLAKKGKRQYHYSRKMKSVVKKAHREGRGVG